MHYLQKAVSNFPVQIKTKQHFVWR